jgi:hypothetical protein
MPNYLHLDAGDKTQQLVQDFSLISEVLRILD